MPSKEFHKNRIKELEFQKNIKINKDNKSHTNLVAFLSVTTVLLIFQLQSMRNIGWLMILTIMFALIIWVINKEKIYEEDELIQNNYDALMGRKK